MKIAFYSARPFDKHYFEQLRGSHAIDYIDCHLDEQTAGLAAGFDAVCCFVNDTLDATVIDKLAAHGVKLIALRSAGFNHVNLDAAKRHQIPVLNVPKYSPYAVAEHALALILALNRKIHRAYNRVREHDFTLHGLLGFDLHGKTIGVIGTGYIGSQFCRIMQGFGVTLLASDPNPDQALIDLGVQYCDLQMLLTQSDIITLHCPLNESTHHLINAERIAKMKHGVMLINTSRGGMIESAALIDALKTGQIGALGIDVYEEEGPLFFEDRSDAILTDDTLARLLTFPNVIVTGHQAFFTEEALHNIAKTTLANIDEFAQHRALTNAV